MQNDKELTVFDNNRRFVFTNWTVEDFIGQWGGEKEVIEKGAIKEYPMFLAYHYAKHLTDREMFRDHKEVMMTVPDERKKYIDKTITEITGDTESPALMALKDKLRKEIEAEKSMEMPEGATIIPEEVVKAAILKGKKGSSKTGIPPNDKAEVEFADLK